MKDLMELYLKKQLFEMQKYFINNMEEFSIKVGLDKKSEKNILYCVKYQNKEEMKRMRGDPLVKSSYL